MTQRLYPHLQLTGQIIGCAMKVHSTLGSGFQEVIYQRALAIEFKDAKLNYAREMQVPVYYHNIEIGTRRVDFLVENSVIVELKAITVLDDIHFAQTINYLEAYRLKIGLLINFGTKNLEFRRFINSKI